MKTRFNPWPISIVAVFVLLFCGITAVIVIAATHSDSMVSENYYEQELTYQNQIDSTARAQKSGAAITADSAGGNVLTVCVPASQLTQNFSGTIELYRPSDPKLDQALKLVPRADGTQKLDSSRLAAGLWLVRLKWSAAGLDYFLEKKITVTGI